MNSNGCTARQTDNKKLFSRVGKSLAGNKGRLRWFDHRGPKSLTEINSVESTECVSKRTGALEKSGMAKAKPNDPLATRRVNSLPKAEKVRDAKELKGAHAKAVLQQIRNDEDNTSLRVLPNGRIPAPPSTQGYSK